MTKHYNPSIVERTNRIFRPKAGDQFTDEVQGLVAVVPVLPVCRISRSGVALNAASVTVYTTPADKDFYLVAAAVGVSKDATATSVGSYIQAVIDGATQILLIIPGTTLTAQSEVISQNWPHPIKIDRGTNIIVTGTTSVANVRTYATIQGYTEETTAT